MARSIHRLGLRTAFTSIIGTCSPRVGGRGDVLENVLANTSRCRRYATVGSTLSCKALKGATFHDRLPKWRCSFANPSVSYPSIMTFDKVPDKLPEWWDDEDDDDDDGDDDDKRDEERINGGDSGRGERSGGSGGYGSGGGGGGGSSGGDGGGKGKEGLFVMLLAMYVQAIKTNPILTKAASTGILAIIGDNLAQRIAQRGKEDFVFDIRRSASIGIWGFCMMGPVLHYWYAILDRLFFGKFAVLNKLLSDQLFFAPLFNGAFMAGVGSLEGHPVNEVTETVQTKLWPMMKANWTLWPAAQVINFALVPKTFQIVYVNCVALVWNVILAYIAHNE